ncbi:MAG: PEP-CTERM sorting domain-containing protein [Planctomycetes bacterium]|nr:PEP-CTERM sorting domain-containing protein [Planctomycetota bacterium]
MMRPLILIALLTGMILFVSGTAAEAAIVWNGNGDGANWGDPDNWDLDRVPNSSDTVTLGGSTVSVAVPDAVMDRFSGGGTVNIDSGGVLTGSHAYTLRYISKINVNGGGLLPAGASWDIRINIDVNAGGRMTGAGRIGAFESRTLNIYGTFEPRGTAGPGAFTLGSTGSVNYDGHLSLQTGGTVVLDVFASGSNEYFDVSGLDNGTALDLNAGSIVLRPQGYAVQVGDVFDLWQQTNAAAVMNVGDGSNISIEGSALTLDTSLWASDGIVTVVPEPAGLALIGLGGLFIRRRRRG